MTSQAIAIASDHAGVDYKALIIEHLKTGGFQTIDLGCHDHHSVDYPDFASRLCHEIINGKAEKGILICGSGIGMSIAANRYPNIRAALCQTSEIAILSRQHNDANVLCLGSRMISTNEALSIIDAFLHTEFEGGRHASRITKLTHISTLDITSSEE